MKVKLFALFMSFFYFYAVQAQDLKVYKNVEHNFRVSIPKSWEVEEFSVGAAVARFTGQQGDFIANCTVTIIPEKKFNQSQKWLDENLNHQPLTETFESSIIKSMKQEGFSISSSYTKKIPVKPVAREALFYSGSFDSKVVGKKIFMDAVHLPYSMRGQQVDLSCRGGGLSKMISYGSFETYQQNFLVFFESFRALK